MNGKLSKWSSSFIFTASTAMVGCASLPDAKIRYYLPKTSISANVVVTLACSEKAGLVAAYAANPKVSHTADLDAQREINLEQLQGWFSDSDIKVEFYPDGRIKTVGGSSTGQGEAILTSVQTIMGTLAGLHASDENRNEVCQIIDRYTDDDTPLSITYSGKVDMTAANNTQPLVAAQGVRHISRQLEPYLGQICVHTGTMSAGKPRTIEYEPKLGDPVIEVIAPGRANFSIKVGSECDGTPIWDGSVAYAQAGEIYAVPLPKPTLFGKRALVLSLSESSEVSSIQFTSATGASQALNALSGVYDATKGETTAETAAATKAEADLIAQQQRLVACVAYPEACK